MKHILIILSFLLLSSPVIGNSHKGETLYLWETPSGNKWLGFGKKDTHSKYTGQVKDGKPNGLSKVSIFPDSMSQYSPFTEYPLDFTHFMIDDF